MILAFTHMSKAPAVPRKQAPRKQAPRARRPSLHPAVQRVQEGRVGAPPRTGRSHGAAFGDLLVDSDPQALIARTRSGVQAVVIRDLAALLHRPVAELGLAIGLSRATLARKIRSAATLPLAESDRAVRYVRLWRLAVQLWESDAAAAEWLTSPERALGGETPLHHAETEVGARRVEQLIGQLEHGIAP